MFDEHRKVIQTWGGAIKNQYSLFYFVYLCVLKFYHSKIAYFYNKNPNELLRLSF